MTAQNKMRAAVVIGVSKSAGLPKLDSAQSGARSIGSWLEKLDPGYDVTIITDEAAPVTISHIKTAIAKFLTPARYEMLVVYYIGHGLYHRRSDIWLLSDLPTDMGACIDLRETRDDAKFCGVPNVVFISDTCRSLPDNIGLARAQPTGAFPFLEQYTSTTTKVDYFCATAQGFPAYEGVIGGMKQSYLTHALKQAYSTPRPDMLAKFVHDNKNITIVPNRRLEDFLQDTINQNLGKADFTKTQRIEANVPSGDDVFIAPAVVTANRSGGSRILVPPQFEQISPKTDKSISSVNDWLSSALGRKTEPASWASSLERVLHPILPDSRVQSFETNTGAALRGASIARCMLSLRQSQDGFVELVQDRQEADLDVLRINLGSNRASTLAIELADGRCLLIPALRGYVAHMTVDQAGLSALSYVRSGGLQSSRERTDRLRALVTVAMNEGHFQVGSEEDAKRLAEKIRVGKAMDPVLGLLAAYAYSEAGLDQKIKNVSKYMRLDIGADFFDVRLLSNRRWQEDGPSVVLPCPMLTQGWSLLRSRGAEVHTVFKSAPISNSLFTTFQAGRANDIMAATEAGEF